MHYDAVPVALEIFCRERTDVTRCLDGSVQECVSCTGYDVRRRSLSPNAGFGYGSIGAAGGSSHPQEFTGCRPRIRCGTR